MPSRTIRPFRALVVLASSLMAIATVQANPIDSHELNIIDLIAGGPGSGYLTARTCEECPIQRLTLSSETKLFLRGQTLPARDGWRLRGKGSVVRVDRSTGRVIDIRVRH